MSAGANQKSNDAAASRRAAITAEFDAWAPSYESGRLAPWYQMHAREVFGHLDLANVRRVLDIGCGTGWALRQLAAEHPKIEFHGIDLSPRMIAEAEQRATSEGFSNVAFHQGDWEKLRPEIAAGKHAVQPGFDLALALSSLHYMADLKAALAHIRESLYAGGKLVLVERDTQGSSLTRLWGALHKFVLRDGVEFADTGELMTMMQSVGFEDVRVLARKRQFLRHGKLFTSVVLIEGARSK
ncbi:class I SAM-dependent methyltransferase [Altererythrobacter lutimaris]|nr:class I SAM-dependent methyltransferase [Altererythrobacter lutimaris]